MNHHVASYLVDVEPVVPDFDQADHLVGYDVEDKDIKCMVACIGKELLEFPFMFVDPATDVIGHQESQ